MMSRSTPFRVLFLVLIATIWTIAQAPERAKRLILKNGDYQKVTKWEVQGDRVRYYSAERYVWEELPISLVDWDATEKYEKEHSENQALQQRELTKEEQAERAAEDARSPEVAPGERLPADGGIFLLDQVQGRPELQEIQQNGGELNRQTGKNILRAAINPIASSTQTIEIPGQHSRLQAHTQTPVIYANLDVIGDADAQDAEGPAQRNPKDAVALADRYRIVRARIEAKRDVRIVGNLKISMIGKISQHGNWVNVTAEPMTGGWVKLTPTQPLEPGEYAVIEMLSPKSMNLYVWDFGVNPKQTSSEVSSTAPASNAQTATPQPSQETPTLSGRPK